MSNEAQRQPVGISVAAYRLPLSRLSVEELDHAGVTRSPAAVLRDFGFEYCHLCPPGTDGLADQLIECGQEALETAGRLPAALDRLLLYSGLDMPTPAPASSDPLALFR